MSYRPPFRRSPEASRGRSPVPRRYKVMLHNSVEHGLRVLARAVMELTHYGQAEAEFRMWDAHFNGRTLVLVTHLERAELYVEQFGERGLAASIEPLGDV